MWKGRDLTKCDSDILHKSIHLIVMWLLYIPAPLATCQYQTITWTFLHSHPTPIHALMLQERICKNLNSNKHIYSAIFLVLWSQYTLKRSEFHPKSALDEITG